MATNPMSTTGTPKNQVCTRCHQEKNLETGFSKQTKGKNGRQTICKACLRLARNTPESRERSRNSVRKYQSKASSILKSYQKGAEKRGLVFELTIEDITTHFWQKPCHYCGDILSTAGIDRVKNDDGYTLLNTVPCCKVCNFMKHQLDLTSFIEKCKRISYYKGVFNDNP